MDDPGPPLLRTVVVDRPAQVQLHALGDLPRIDDALAALSGAFEAHPKRYPIIESDLRVARFFFRDGSPPVAVLFQVSNDELTVVAARADPEQLDDDEEF